jgi:hypothetical protein
MLLITTMYIKFAFYKVRNNYFYRLDKLSGEIDKENYDIL